MLDFFVIFSKSGIVLFATVNQTINGMNGYVNKLIKNVILEDRMEVLNAESIALQYRLDNEFELVFVVGYQKMLSLSYIDKFLDDIQLAFRDKYNDYELTRFLLMKTLSIDSTPHSLSSDRNYLNLLSNNIIDFDFDFNNVYAKCYKLQTNTPQQEMRSFDQSLKSKKTVASMIIQPKSSVKEVEVEKPIEKTVKTTAPNNANDIMKKLSAMAAKNSTSPKASKNKSLAQKPVKKQKGQRVWELGGKNDQNLDFSKKIDESEMNGFNSSVAKNVANSEDLINYDNIDMQPDLEFEVNDDDEDEEEVKTAKPKSSIFGSIMKTFNYNKSLTYSDLEPILNQLKDHLIAKNVASEIATKLCDSVATKLEGQQVNTWIGLKGFVRNALEDSILRILSPNRNINILRDVRAKSSPYTIVFCGVNGVGKSTNLAKIANWLIVNDVRVLVIACDTFRAGAIEQLRTHITALKNIHEKDGKSKIDLFEKGYGKDSAAIAMEGINYARTAGYKCCLVDTAGRMQGNEPLMKQLAKLIKINEPDLTLFVGEALVGNEAVDQLMKFNTALVDNGCRGVTSNSSAINGIVLTKFDTIDDQVGAAISMTYITGQPIVFVGVGQTYRDLKQLNAKAVVKALMK